MPTRELTVRIPIDDDLIRSLTEVVTNAVEQAIKPELNALAQRLSVPKELPAPTLKPAAATGGVALTEGEKLKAADLRTALLSGKIGDTTGLLIDLSTLAGLLSISSRALRRLADLKAVPQPIRMGSLIRWRLAEILAWIDAGCPPQRHWAYPIVETPSKGSR